MPATAPQHHLIIYDIADPKRLRQVARLLEDHGVRLQNSVFDCWLTAPQLHRLQSKLLARIHLGEDSLRYIPLCTRDYNARKLQHPPTVRPPETQPPRAWII